MFEMQKLKPELRATGKQRKFFRILTGSNARRGITRGELNELIQGHSQAQIDKARLDYKGQRRASKFVRYILGRLKGQVITAISRKQAELELHNHSKEDIRTVTREWRASGEGK